MANANLDEAEILKRFDRSSPETLLRSIAKELVRLEQTQTALLARVAAMESVLAVADRIAAAEVEEIGAIYPSALTIDAGSSFVGAHGFHGLEHDQKGEPYRWSGPDPQFSFQFFVDRRVPVRFTLRFGQLYADSPVDNLACLVDGAKVGLKVARAAGGYEASGVMPPRSDRGGSVLTFVCPKMASPASQGHSDARQLGVSFRLLTVQADQGAVVGLSARADAVAGNGASAVSVLSEDIKTSVGAPKLEPKVAIAVSRGTKERL